MGEHADRPPTPGRFEPGPAGRPDSALGCQSEPTTRHCKGVTGGSISYRKYLRTGVRGLQLVSYLLPKK